MHRLKWFVRTPRRAVATAVVAALVIPGTAAAAWVIFTGATGTGNGKFATATQGGAAVTLTTNYSAGSGGTACSPAGTCDVLATATNNAGVAESILPASSQPTGAVKFTSTPTDCASHMTLNPAYAGQSIAANASSTSVTLASLVSVDSSLPNDCSAGTFTVTLNLATNP